MRESLADIPTGTVLTLISAGNPAPGAGAASAIALGLAAACVAKAVSISYHHTQEPRLAAALRRLTGIREFALKGADADARTFEDFIHEGGTETAHQLIQAGQRMARLADVLFGVIEAVEPLTIEVMKGDLSAARSLASAARAIQVANTNEAAAAATRNPVPTSPV